MIRFSTETHNNEQVWKVFSRISAETYLKMDYFGSKLSKIAKRWEFRPQITLLLLAGISPLGPRTG